MKFLVVLLCLSWCSISRAKVEFPDGFIKCPKDNTFSDCFAKAAPVDSMLLKDGYAAGGIPPLQPMDVGEINLKVGGEKYGIFINTFLDDSKTTYTLTNVSNVNIDFSTGEFQFDALFKDFTGKARHNTTGRFLISNIAGHGRYTSTLYDVVYTIHAKIGEVEKGGKKYFNLKNLTFKLKSLRKAETDFALVPNKQVNDAIIKAINENWEALLRPIVTTLENHIGPKVEDHLNNHFFSKIPIEDLVLPK